MLLWQLTDTCPHPFADDDAAGADVVMDGTAPASASAAAETAAMSGDNGAGGSRDAYTYDVTLLLCDTGSGTDDTLTAASAGELAVPSFRRNACSRSIGGE